MRFWAQKLSGSTSGTANFFEYYSLQSFLDNFVNFFFCGYYSAKLFSPTSLNIRKLFFYNFAGISKLFHQSSKNFSVFLAYMFSFRLNYCTYQLFKSSSTMAKTLIFLDNKTLCIASQQCNAISLLCNTLLCLVLAIFLQKQKSLHGTASV